jgi:hypothetical protein
LKVMHDGRRVTVEVTAGGAGLVSHAGSVLVAQIADNVGLTSALSLRLGFTFACLAPEWPILGAGDR